MKYKMSDYVFIGMELIDGGYSLLLKDILNINIGEANVF